MSLPAQPPPPPPPSRHHEHETLIQYNLRNKVCAFCKRPGALLKCEGCRQRSYCDRKCQKRDWKQEHRGQCEKLQQVFVPPEPGWRGAAAEVGGGGGGGKAAAAAAVDIDEDDIENPCPICLDNEDDATVDGKRDGMCLACGQYYCGACNAGGFADRSPNCPTCRAPFSVSDEENFTRCWKLVHDRSPGRHTPAAQYFLGCRYEKGEGVEQDHVEAAKWYRKSAEAGYAPAQCNLGVMYVKGNGVKQDRVEAAKWFRKSAEAGNTLAQCNLGIVYANGKGVEQDLAEALKWVQLAAEQGCKRALRGVNNLQQENLTTPPPGTAVTIILLTSTSAAKYANRTGRVVEPTEGAAIKPGRVAVLLDGEAEPISFKLMNVRVQP